MRKRAAVVVFGIAAIGFAACVPDYTFQNEPQDGGVDAPAAPPDAHHDDAPAPMIDGGVDAPPPPVDSGLPVLVEAGTPGCVQITNPPDEGTAHIPIGQMFDYGTDPPASGPHYAEWAAYAESQVAIDYGYLVHDLEHGAIVLWYRCPENGNCEDIKTMLRAVSAAMPTDQQCVDAGTGVRVRTIIVPNAKMDVPIAAAGWDWLYRATCIDQTTLLNFAKAHYDQSPEPANCDQGVSF